MHEKIIDSGIIIPRHLFMLFVILFQMEKLSGNSEPDIGKLLTIAQSSLDPPRDGRRQERKLECLIAHNDIVLKTILELLVTTSTIMERALGERNCGLPPDSVDIPGHFLECLDLVCVKRTARLLREQWHRGVRLGRANIAYQSIAHIFDCIAFLAGKRLAQQGLANGASTGHDLHRGIRAMHWAPFW